MVTSPLSKAFILSSFIYICNAQTAYRIASTLNPGYCAQPGDGDYQYYVELKPCDNSESQKWSYMWVNTYKQWVNRGNNLCMARM